ncbi:unnamed protein product [Leptosia nina]|uniref:Amine oxidase domain-containing protein n=1 Tax=Leptosia nina TaxID=320188 RepID=A0AAV1K102_9NEOP
MFLRLAVLLLVSYCACAAQSYDVIVVGLGSSGVTASSILAKAGRKVLGLEAMDRIGGRVKTVSFGDGVIEEGAEWIAGTENSRVYDLAIENNITVLPQDFDSLIFRSDGNQTYNKAYYDLLNLVMEKSMGASDPSFKSEGDYLTAEILSFIKKNYPHLENDKVFIDQVLDLMNFLISVYVASNDWHDITTQSSDEGLGGHQYTSWHVHGYKTFFELMLNTYKNGPGLPNLDIKLSTEVSQIVWPKDGSGDVKVKCADGSTHTAKHVIVTVSLGVLKERSKWYSNPYTRGSYTFDNLDTPKYPKARETLGSPLLDANGVPRVLFAGEATNPAQFGTVHGASESGHREAMRILNK